MRNKVSVVFGALVLLLMVGAVAGYAWITGDVVAKVPFAFTVADKTLPAGDYVISAPETNNPKLLEVHQEKGPLGVLVMTEDASASQKPVKTELVFKRFGDKEFLYQVWMEGSDTGSQVVQSREEIQLEKVQSKAEHHRVPAAHRAHSK